jgi:hypothetical protein
MKTYALAAAFALGLSGAAFAKSEMESQCEAYVMEHGSGDTSGCSCLAAKASADPALDAALRLIETPGDLEAADDATKEKIAACFPGAG